MKLVKSRGGFRLVISGVRNIYTDGIIGHTSAYTGKYTHDILLGWHKKIKDNEYGNAIAIQVDYKYGSWHDLLGCKDGINIVNDCIDRLKEDMKSVLLKVKS